MSAPIEFHFDFSSPYGYFASTKIDALAAKYGREVVWKPILLGATFKVTGLPPLPTVPLKGDYSRHDFARSARFHGVPYSHPTVFPIATQAPARAFYWADARDPAKAKALASALLKAYFRERREHLESIGYGCRGGVPWLRRSRSGGGAQRPGGQGKVEDGSRRRHRSRGVRFTLRVRRRRAFLGLRPFRPDRALARHRRILKLVIRPRFRNLCVFCGSSGDAIRVHLDTASRWAACSRSKASASSMAAGASE